MKQEGIDLLEKLKIEHPKYSQTINEIIKLAKQGEDEAALMCLTIFNLIKTKYLEGNK